MSADAVSRLMSESGALSGAFLAVDPLEASALYSRLKRLPAVTAVTVKRTSEEGFDQTLAESFEIPLRLLIAFACVIAAGLVYNGMSVAMSERYREIGTLRALGFSRGEVTRLMLAEQGVLTIAGIPVGAALGSRVHARHRAIQLRAVSIAADRLSSHVRDGGGTDPRSRGRLGTSRPP